MADEQLRVTISQGPIYDHLWNWAYQIGIICIMVDGRISVWGHAQSLRAFMQTWREWYGEPKGLRVLGADSVEHCGVEVLIPDHAFVGPNPAATGDQKSK